MSGAKAAIALAAMGLMLGACHHKKERAQDRSDYISEVVNDAPQERKPEKSRLRKEVRSWLGVPYRYGGHSRSGTDCSGLVMEVYGAVYGIKVTHNSSDLFHKECRKIDERELKEGDLVFFAFNTNGRINHVGIYLGNGDFVHASSSRGVIISNLGERYYRKGFVGAGRIF